MEQYIDYFNGRPGYWRGLEDRAQARMLALAERLAVGLDAVGWLDLRSADLASVAAPVTVIRGSAAQWPDRFHPNHRCKQSQRRR